MVVSLSLFLAIFLVDPAPNLDARTITVSRNSGRPHRKAHHRRRQTQAITLACRGGQRTLASGGRSHQAVPSSRRLDGAGTVRSCRTVDETLKRIDCGHRVVVRHCPQKPTAGQCCWTADLISRPASGLQSTASNLKCRPRAIIAEQDRVPRPRQRARQSSRPIHGRQMGQGTVFEVGIDLFDDGVPAVGLLAVAVSRTSAGTVMKNTWCRRASNRVSKGGITLSASTGTAGFVGKPRVRGFAGSGRLPRTHRRSP